MRGKIGGLDVLVVIKNKGANCASLTDRLVEKGKIIQRYLQR
jgi:hypothetical protein